jgi:6-phosphofructokinase 1
VPIAQVAGRNRLVPVDHALLSAARGIGVALGDD